VTAPRGWVALAAAAVLLSGCITDPHVLEAESGGQPTFAVHPLQPPSIYLSAQFFRGHHPDAELGELFRERVRSAAEDLGFRVVSSRSEADYLLSTDLRGWWARSARFAMITTATLTLYTPLDYKWILDVDLTDRSDNPVGSLHERGGFRFETFGIVLFPATLYAYYQLVMPHWREIARESAQHAAGVLVSALGTPVAAPVAGER
jgi:hypothetical protein